MTSTNRDSEPLPRKLVEQFGQVWPGLTPERCPGPGVDSAFEDAVQVFGGRERASRRQSVYFTQGAASYVRPGSESLEFIAVAATPVPAVATMLQAVAFAQWTLELGAQIGRISDLGEPWVPGSNLDHLYFSPPYLLPAEMWHVAGTESAHWCWVVPITASEALYGLERGADALETVLERAAAPIGALSRGSVVC